MRRVFAIRQIILMTSLLVGAATIGLVLILIAKGTGNIGNQYFRNLEIRSKLFQESIRESMLSGDYPSVIQKSRLLSHQEDVVKVQVHLEDGSEIASFRRDEVSDSGPLYSTVDNIYFEDSEEPNKAYGFLKIDYDLRHLSRAQAKTLTEVSLVGAALLAIMVVLIWLFSKYFFAPLSKLQSIALKGDLKGFSNLDSASRLKELNSLEDALSSMAEGLMKAEQTNREFAVVSAIAETARLVAHDIRSPVMALRAAAKTAQGLPEPNKQLILSAADRVEKIASDLLLKCKSSLEQPQKGAGFDVIQSCLRIIEEQRALINQPRVELKLEVGAKDLVSKVGSAPIFERVLSNMINNAVEAVQESGTVFVSVSRCQEGALVAISDSGPGIDPALVEAALKGPVNSTKTKGSGLGLHNAMKTIADWNGKLDVRPIAGKGTVVQITLPV